MAIYKLLAFVSVFLGVLAHLSLKKATNKINFRGNFLKKITSMYFNPWVILGAFIFFLSMFFFIIALSKIDLSYAYPLASLNFVLVSLGSKYFFKEKVSKLRWISIIIILLGVLLLSVS